MKKIIFLLPLIAVQQVLAQTDTSANKYKQIDTVQIAALGQKSAGNIPYNIQRVNLNSYQRTPRPQMMLQLAQLPSVSSISSGSGINKPVIRGLSFNHIQLFANGMRIDNQTWDDRHDIGISDIGYDKVAIINGPAALIYGPNTLGGAIIIEQKIPALNEKTNGYAQLGFFGNSMGGNLSAGLRGAKNNFYYTADASMAMHANYVQGEGEEKNTQQAQAEDKPLAGNSKYNNVAFKGMIGSNKEKSNHQLTYSLYSQNLGIIEDEGDTTGGATKPPAEERDYEMEAPYQNVVTHLVSLQNNFKIGRDELTINAGYQFNQRKEYEPDSLPKSKFLGVGLNLQTLTADVEWHSDKTKPTGITIGVQEFYQNNKNTGNFVLVPDAHVSTIGAFAVGYTDYKKWNFVYGIRVDAHQLQMFTTKAKLSNAGTVIPAFPAPKQDLEKKYTPYSFSAGLVFHPTKQWNLKLNVANGYAAPNYAQLTSYGKHEGTYRFELGNNNLNMEKNINVDGSIEYNDAAVSFSLGGYVNAISDYIYINPGSDSVGKLRVYRWTQHDAQISGAEASLDVHPQDAKWFDAYLKAGFLSGKLKGGGGDLPYIPAGKVITGFTWKKDNCKKWQQLYATLQLNNYFKQSKVAQFEEATDGYFLADIFIGASPKLGKDHRWNFTAFCTNLFNKGYFDHLSLVKTIDVREPGRNIGIQIQYAFK